jgi:cystathionine beta-lyase/cystathionine gamma-synthase
MTDDIEPFELASFLVAHDSAHVHDAVVPPIVQSSLFTFTSYAEMEATFRGQKVRAIYTRGRNPTVRAFEDKVAGLEGAEDALGFASGMAAIASTVITFVSPGDRILCVRHVYPDAYRLFESLFARFGIGITYVDGSDEKAVAAALPGARLFYMESPTSWIMDTHDVGALAALARSHAVISVIDNSWATPIFQRPLSLGVDLVLHSASKYLSGHSDVVAGIVAGSAALIGRIRAETYPFLGGKLSPFEAWLLLRGLRTLPIRMKAHEAAALYLAQRLASHASVLAVNHPGLGQKLPAGLEGTSGLFSFVFRDEIDIPAFVDGLRIFKLGVSWGGHESLVIPAKIARTSTGLPNSVVNFGVDARIIRLHIGLEGAEVLWNDLVQAMELARQPHFSAGGS